MMSTVARGNSFRDQVVALLSAAGFDPVAETREIFKKADITWLTYELDGPVRYGGEAKDHEGTLSLAECTEFAAQYGALVRKGELGKAWLISCGPITPDGRAMIDSEEGLRALTFAEFQRRILRIDPYLQFLVRKGEEERLSEWYMLPRSTSGSSLTEDFKHWLRDPRAPPLLIMGGYGTGKSTFALHTCAQMAVEALADASKRVPILVPLGDIVDENSMEGLLGKVLSTIYLADRYNYALFSRLNESGRFVIFFDGFDEMKHGMTFSKFERMVRLLLETGRGAAKVVILGRHTALHNEAEVKAIIDGRQTTMLGFETKIEGREALLSWMIADFSLSEARENVARQFPIMLANQKETPSDMWINKRTEELLSGTFDELIVRPVHVKMLCEIATDAETSLDSLTKFGLYERFVRFLLKRELDKRGRDPIFDAGVRMLFNSNLATWLWQRGAATTIDLGKIPIELCERCTSGIRHEYDEDALRRELAVGCLIEKSAGTFYFSHRSLQEFLVCAYIILESGRRTVQPEEFVAWLSQSNREISSFMMSGAAESEKVSQAVKRIFNGVKIGERMSLSTLAVETLVDIADHVSPTVPRESRHPVELWTNFFRLNQNIGFNNVTPAALKYLTRMLRVSGRLNNEFHVNVLMIVTKVIANNALFERRLIILLSLAIDAGTAKPMIETARALGKQVTFTPVNSLGAWVMLQSLIPHPNKRKDLVGFDAGKAEGLLSTLARLSIPELDSISPAPEHRAIPFERLLFSLSYRRRNTKIMWSSVFSNHELRHRFKFASGETDSVRGRPGNGISSLRIGMSQHEK